MSYLPKVWGAAQHHHSERLVTGPDGIPNTYLMEVQDMEATYYVGT